MADRQPVNPQCRPLLQHLLALCPWAGLFTSLDFHLWREVVRLILMESLYLKSARAAEGLKDRLPLRWRKPPQSTSHPQRRGLPSRTWNREWEFSAEKWREGCSGQKARPGQTAGILPREPPSSLRSQLKRTLPPQRGLLLPPRERACHQSSFLSSSHLGPSPE